MAAYVRNLARAVVEEPDAKTAIDGRVTVLPFTRKHVGFRPGDKYFGGVRGSEIDPMIHLANRRAVVAVLLKSGDDF